MNEHKFEMDSNNDPIHQISQLLTAGQGKSNWQGSTITNGPPWFCWPKLSRSTSPLHCGRFLPVKEASPSVNWWRESAVYVISTLLTQNGCVSYYEYQISPLSSLKSFEQTRSHGWNHGTHASPDVRQSVRMQIQDDPEELTPLWQLQACCGLPHGEMPLCAQRVITVLLIGQLLGRRLPNAWLGHIATLLDAQRVVVQSSFPSSNVRIHECPLSISNNNNADTIDMIKTRLCSVRAAQQGSLRLYQCHCVLPINLFNEKICSIWWFYITALLPVTVASLIGWTVRCFARSSRLEFIQRYLTEDEKEGTIPAILLENLGPDGLLLLRLIEINHGSAVLHPVVRCLQQRMAEMAASQTQPASGSISLDLDSSLAPGRPNEDSASPSTPAGLRARRVLGLKNPRHDVTASFRSSSPLSLSLLRRRQHRLASADPFRRLRMRHSLQIHPGSNPALLYWWCIN